MMRNLIFILSLLLTTITQAAVNAQIDRTHVSEGESITLTLSSDTSNSSPDLSILSANFDVLGTSKSNSLSIVNGSMTSQSTWIIQLMPKQVGTIIIPAISLGAEKTTPITIEVTDRASTPNNTNNTATSSSQLGDIFFEASVDKTKTYVQEEIIYTQRLYFRPELRITDVSVEELSVENASVEPLNTKGPKYQKEINGITYQIIEGTYAIFPEKSGSLLIPARKLTVQLQTGMFDPPRIARLTSEETNITVLPQSANQNPWLPAKELTIREEWSASPINVKVGESITRKVIVEAKGLSQSHLPVLPDIKIDNLKIYADKPETKNTVTTDGIIGTRTDSIAIVASKPGTYTLPAISIKWWNTDENVEQTAELPAVSFTVTHNPNQQQTTLPVLPTDNAVASTNPLSQSDTPIFESADTAWKYIAIILLVLWLLTLLLWWRTRSTFKRETANEQNKAPSLQTILSRSSTYDGLLKACQENNAAKARDALLLWGKERWATPMLTLDDLALKEPSLSEEINMLEQSLYAQSSNTWEGDTLLKLIKQMPHHTTYKDKDKSPLTPLYPTK